MASIMDGDRQFHIKAKKGEVGKYVLLPGDPGRVPEIAGLLDEARLISRNREFVLYTGRIDGEPVSVCSTGIGGPSAAIAVEELIKCGADTFIRVGTSGGIRADVTGGDICVATAAVRSEGTSREYLPDGYPAAADFEVVSALVKSVGELYPGKCRTGVVHSKDSFYGEVEPQESPVGDKLLKNWNAYKKCGCIASEMECAAIFSVGLSKGVRCGAVLTALWNVERSKEGLLDAITYDSSEAIRCAVNAIGIMIRNDR